jgi:hypothetical protein
VVKKNVSNPLLLLPGQSMKSKLSACWWIDLYFYFYLWYPKTSTTSDRIQIHCRRKNCQHFERGCHHPWFARSDIYHLNTESFSDFTSILWSLILHFREMLYIQSIQNIPLKLANIEFKLDFWTLNHFVCTLQVHLTWLSMGQLIPT